MKTVLTTSGLSLIAIAIFCLFYGLIKYDGHYDFWWALVKNNDEGMCSWTLPNGYQVVSNGTQYAIKIKDEYVWLRIDDYSTLNWVDDKSRFDDSCKAKLLAFRYYDQELKKAQEKAMVIPFIIIKPPKPTESVKATNYSNTVYINYPNGDTLKTLEERQLLDSAVKDLQIQGGGRISVERTKQGFWINSQASMKAQP